MEKNVRLFDCIEHQIELGAIPDMLAVKENSRWKKYSTADVKNTTLRLAAGLLREGVSRHDNTIESRDKIAILSKNRPEWIMLDMAVQMIGGILTPVYPTINVNELEFILMDAAVKWVFVNDEELYLKVNSLKNKLPELQEIFAFEHVANARHWKELLKNPDPYKIDEAQRIAESIRPEEVATLIYTSGTTRTPKGVMLTHRNIGSNVMASMECFPPGDQLRALSFLPLNHIFERMVTYLYLFKRTSIYYAESLDTIGVDLKEVQPDLFTTVPRLLEKVYDQIMLKGKELTGMKRKLFFWAHGLAEKYNINRTLPMHYRMQLALANKFVFRKWREALGNRVMCIVTGGAACQVRLIRIFTAAGIPIMEGYGLTESSPVICVNRYDVEERMFGTVGPAIPGVEVKIAEDGEIVCSGPNVMAGYYKRPDLTAEVIRDGWLLTGDIGEMVKGRFLKITDRKKELFKTSGGKYVAPLSIESRLKESPYVEQAMVVGAERKYTGALIIPSFPNLLEWCRENGIMETQPEKLVHEPKVQEFYRELVDSFNKFFNQVEQVKKFELLARDWSVETGELTPKLSLKRKVIMEKFRDAIDRIYAE